MDLLRNSLGIGLENVITAISILGNIVQWAYNKYEKIFLLIQKGIFYATNKTTYWNLSLNFSLRGNNTANYQNVLNQILTNIRSRAEVEIYKDYPDTKVLLINGTVHKLFLENSTLSLHTTDQKIPYREAKRSIEKDLMDLIEFIEKSLNSEITSKKFGIVIKFEGVSNPNVSLYLRRAKQKQLKVFSCIIDHSNKTGKHIVTVDLDSISVYAESREEFRRLSMRYIVLSGI